MDRKLATDPKLSGVSDDVSALFVKAERCRRLAAGISDRQASDVLRKMAKNYEDSAARLNSR